MLNHRVPVLIVCALAIAACQPSQAPARQTQEAQSAFDRAIAAAWTQSASSPTPVPSPTQAPAPASTSLFSFPTQPARTSLFNLPPARTPVPGFAFVLTTVFPPEPTGAAWQSQASSVQAVLEEFIGKLGPDSPVPFDVHVTSVRYECYTGCRSVLMDVVVERSLDTEIETAAAVALSALSSIFSTKLYPYDGAVRQRSLVPPETGKFIIHVQDARGREWSRLSGNWQDLIAHGAGSLSDDGLMDRVEYVRVY